MGWSNYLYNKEKNIAIEIGKFDYNSTDESQLANFEEFVEYHNQDEVNEQVKKYLWDKCYIYSAHDFMVNAMIYWFFGNKNYEIISEDKIPNKAIVVNRGI